LIECGRICVEVAEFIAPFVIYPLLLEAVPVNEPGEIDFDLQVKIEDLAAKNAKLPQKDRFLSDQNTKLTQQIADLLKCR
jgi:hypothetical protein